MARSPCVDKTSARTFCRGSLVLFDSDLGEQLLLDLFIKNLPLLLSVCFSLSPGEKADVYLESAGGNLASAIVATCCILAERVLDKFIGIKGHLHRPQRSDDFFFSLIISYNAENNCGVYVFFGHQEICDLRNYVSVFSRSWPIPAIEKLSAVTRFSRAR